MGGMGKANKTCRVRTRIRALRFIPRNQIAPAFELVPPQAKTASEVKNVTVQRERATVRAATTPEGDTKGPFPYPTACF